jgi:hypothetical protein
LVALVEALEEALRTNESHGEWRGQHLTLERLAKMAEHADAMVVRLEEAQASA